MNNNNRFAESFAVIFIQKWGAIDIKMECDKQQNGVTSTFQDLCTQYLYDSTSNFSLNFAESSAVISLNQSEARICYVTKNYIWLNLGQNS